MLLSSTTKATKARDYRYFKLSRITRIM